MRRTVMKWTGNEVFLFISAFALCCCLRRGLSASLRVYQQFSGNALLEHCYEIFLSKCYTWNSVIVDISELRTKIRNSGKFTHKAAFTFTEFSRSREMYRSALYVHSLKKNKYPHANSLCPGIGILWIYWEIYFAYILRKLYITGIL